MYSKKNIINIEIIIFLFYLIMPDTIKRENSDT